MPPEVHLRDEAFAILGAAADTTGNAMNFATIEVTNDPVLYKRLCTELREAFPDLNAKLDYLSLEKLPLLVCMMYVLLIRSMDADRTPIDGCHQRSCSALVWFTWKADKGCTKRRCNFQQLLSPSWCKHHISHMNIS